MQSSYSASGPLSLCQSVYTSAYIFGGPDGRDGAAIYNGEGGTTVAFRGTVCNSEVGFLDWLNDLRTHLVSRLEYPGRVHRGFADSLADLWPQLGPLPLPVTFTGHSKGGALALLAAARLATLNGSGAGIRVVTFAAPKVGDYAFVAHTAVGELGPSLLECYENRHDIVPRLPFFGYSPPRGVIPSPEEWIAPHGVIANHRLDTGYAPWISDCSQAA